MNAPRLVNWIKLIIATIGLLQVAQSSSQRQVAAASNRTDFKMNAAGLSNSAIEEQEVELLANQQQQHPKQHPEQMSQTIRTNGAEEQEKNRSRLVVSRRLERGKRIYRIRAAGANGSFNASPTGRRVHLDQGAELGANNEFGARHQVAPTHLNGIPRRKARLLSVNNGQNCSEQANVSTMDNDKEIENENDNDNETNIASGISTSSQILHLSNKLGTTQRIAPNQSLVNDWQHWNRDEDLKRQQTDQQEPQTLDRSRDSNSMMMMMSLIDEFDSRIVTNKTEVLAIRLEAFDANLKDMTSNKQQASQLQLVDSLATMARNKSLSSLSTAFWPLTTNLSSNTHSNRNRNQNQNQNFQFPTQTTQFDDDRDIKLMPLNSWQWIHYNNNNNNNNAIVNSTRPPKLADYAQLTQSTDADLQMSLELVDLRQNQLGLLFQNHFNLSNITAKIMSNQNGLWNSNNLNQNQNGIENISNDQKHYESQRRIGNLTGWSNWDHLAQLTCDSGEMIVRLNFSQPFRGVVYPDHNRVSPCRFFGDGHLNYELRLPLRACGTKQLGPRVFVNDVTVRFHKTLELEEDEVKTLICRYPAPLDTGSGQRERELNSPSNRTLLNEDQQQQFELLEPILRPANRLALGAQFNRLKQQPRDYADLVLARQQASIKGVRPALGAETNSRLLDLSAQPGQTQANVSSFARPSSTPTANLLDRLTSVELLFLISSLMFLVLVALALALSYCCFWRPRQARNRGRRNLRAAEVTSQNLFGAGRKSRYFDTTHLTSPNFNTDPTRSQFVGANAAGRLYSAHSSQQQHHHHHRAPPTFYYHNDYLDRQARMAAAAAAPSSPDESDVSNRVLLAGANGTTTTGRRNRGWVTSATVGRRPAPVGQAKPAPDVSQHYRASSIVGRGTEAGHYLGSTNLRDRQTRAHAVRPAGATLGRVSVREPLLRLSSADELASVDSPPQIRHAQSTQHLDLATGEQLARQRHLQRLAALSNSRHLFGSNLVESERHQESSQFHAPTTLNRHRPESNYKRPRQRQLISVDCSSSSSSSSTTSSDNELEPNNNNHFEGGGPKLILKSIEDSFVTNLTEVQEQEYFKSDSRTPLSWTEWVAAKRAAANQNTAPTESKLAPDQQSNSDSNDQADEQSGEFGPPHRTASTCLRSLTELNVDDHSKSLPRNAEREADFVGKSQDSPDLIISKEYNFGRFKLIDDKQNSATNSRRGLKSPGAESHDSVSYV